MVKRKFLWQLLALATALFASCSTSDTDEETPELPPIPEEELVVNGEMKDLLITGFVHDTAGEPLAGVTVVSGTSVMQTNSSGMFTFSSIDMVRNRSVVRFKKEGYFDVVRSFKSSDGDSWEVVMCSKGNGSFMSSTTYSSNTSENIKAGGLKIEMPANGYVVDATGSGFAGKVKADVVYLDPNNENFQAMMPGGDLAAVRADGSDAMLVSYGMTGVNLTDEAGNKLQLKPGNTAKLTFPVPEGMEENLPASIPLWSFNEKTGLWEEEGAATLQGKVYVGEVKHFSWVNLDYPEEQAKVKGYVRNANGKPLANIRVTVGQVATSALTNTEGYYEQEVPAEVAFEITVKAKHYGNYRNIFAVPVKALDKKEEHTVNITLPTLHTLRGRIVNQGAGTNIASVWLQYGSRKTNSVSSGKDGVFSMYQPEGYAGNAVLMVQTGDGDIVTREIEIGNSDMNVGDIIINSATGAGGVLSLKLSDSSDASFSISDASETSMGGVMVADGSLMFMADEDESELSGNEFVLQVNGYDSSKGSYENGSVFASDKEQQFVCEGAAKVNISRNGSKLQGRILFEDISSGRKWLSVITDAMRNNQVLHITHHGFGKPEALSFDIEPYYLKVVKRRWYVLARNPYYSECNRQKNLEDKGDRPEDVYLMYALDRIVDCQPKEETFLMNEEFDIDEYFRGCYGIIHSDEEPTRVVIKAYDSAPDYLRTLPLHKSQRELKEIEDDEAAYFELEVCPTYDFYQALLAQTDLIEVVEPETVRKQMLNFAKNIMSYYKQNKDD